MGLFDSSAKKLDAATAELNNTIADLKLQIADLKAEQSALTTERDATKRIKALQEQISKLEIDKGKIVEDNARQQRETTHMVGLERKRQEFEAEQAMKGIERARAEAIIEVREKNLTAEREAFEQHMKFQNDRFTAEVGYLKELMGDILDRLPTVTVDRKISDRTTTTKPTA